jgi:hypothetical protein
VIVREDFYERVDRTVAAALRYPSLQAEERSYGEIQEAADRDPDIYDEVLRRLIAMRYEETGEEAFERDGLVQAQSRIGVRPQASPSAHALRTSRGHRLF